MAFPESNLGIKVELALGSVDFGPSFYQWTDVSDSYAYRIIPQNVRIKRGRADESSRPQPTQVSLTLDNLDGALTPRDPRALFYPGLRKGTPFRMSIEGAESAAVFPGGFGSWAETPVDPTFFFFNEFDVRVRVDPDQWNADNFLERRQPLATMWQPDLTWKLELANEGQVMLSVSPDGANYTELAPARAVAASGPIWVGVAFRANNGDGVASAKVYTSEDTAPPAAIEEWEYIGEDTAASAFAPNAPTTSSLRVGQSYAFQEDGFHGRILAVELRNSVNGVLVASPDFSAQPAGTTSFDDSTGKTWTVGPDVEFSTMRPVFVGRVDVVDPRWPSGDNEPAATDPATGNVSEARVDMTASGELRRLMQGRKPTQSTLYRHVLIPSNLDDVIGYWPMEDDDGADRFATPLDGQSPATVSSLVKLGADGSFVAAKALPTLESGKLGQWAAPIVGGPDDAWAVDIFVRTPEPIGDPDYTQLFEIQSNGSANLWAVDLNDDKTRVTITAPGGAIIDQVEHALPVVDFDSWQLYRFQAEQSAPGVVQWSLVRVDLSTGGGGGPSSAFSGTLARPTTIGNSTLGPPGGMSFGHVIVSNGTRPLGWTAGADSAWIGETAAARFARLCSEEGIPFEVYGDPVPRRSLRGDPAYSELMGYQRQNSIVDLLNECADTDRGVLSTKSTAAGLVFRTHSTLYEQTPALTLDAGLSQITQPFEPNYDDQRTQNDVTVRSVGGSSARVEDQAHIAAEGLYDVEESIVGVGGVRIQDAILGAVEGLSVAVDTQNEQHASWLLHVGTFDGLRYSSVAIDLVVSSELSAGVHTIDLGDRVQVTNLPVQHPPDTVELIVEAIEHQLTPTGWITTLTTSPGDPLLVGVLSADGATPTAATARLDSAPSVTTSFVTPTATEIPVDDVSWTDDVGDFPLRLRIGGELVEASGIDTAGLHTFTGVTRSLNGAVLLHVPGTEVTVDKPITLALGPGQFAAPSTDDAGGQQYQTLYQSDFTEGASILDDFNLYTGAVGTLNGNNGWGGRRASQVEISTTHPTEGAVMNITAEMGSGADAGILISGGAKLWGDNQGDMKFRYGRVRCRMRMDLDPDQVTSGLALLWQADTPTVKGPEVNIFENFAFRDTRNPVQMFLHWGENGEFQKQSDYGFTSFGSDWADYELIWLPELMTLQRNTDTPIVLSTDPVEIPQEFMELSFQNDAWAEPSIVSPDPGNPAHQPVLTGPRVLQISSFSIETLA